MAKGVQKLVQKLVTEIAYHGDEGESAMTPREARLNVTVLNPAQASPYLTFSSLSGRGQHFGRLPSRRGAGLLTAMASPN